MVYQIHHAQGLPVEAYILSEMTWPEVEEALKQVKIAIIPVGAHEQHGPHMTESCDAVLAEAMAVQLARRVHPISVVAPTIPMGISPHHMRFPGTISLQPDTLLSVLRDMVSSLKQHGIQNFLFMNGHGGNQGLLGTASTVLSAELDVNCYYAKTTASAKQAIAKHVTSKLFGHSCEREVSEALYLAPQLVRQHQLVKADIVDSGRWTLLRPGRAIQGFYRYDEMTRSGNIGDATQASYDIGQDIVEEALDNLSSQLIELLEATSA
jgi:creatinine amidohydrolase